MAAAAPEHGRTHPPPHGSARLTREDMVPLLGTPSRVSEVLRGKKELSMAMVQRLRARFHLPADLLIPPPKEARRASRRAAA